MQTTNIYLKLRCICRNLLVFILTIYCVAFTFDYSGNNKGNGLISLLKTPVFLQDMVSFDIAQYSSRAGFVLRSNWWKGFDLLVA